MSDSSERVNWTTLLSAQPKRTIVAVSTKAAARVFPIIFEKIDDDAATVQIAVLLACRALLGGVCASYDSHVSDLNAIGRAAEMLMEARHSLTEEAKLAAESLAQAARSSVSGALSGVEAINTATRAAIGHKERHLGAAASETEDMIRGGISRDIAQLIRHKSEGHELFVRAPLAADPIYGDVTSNTWERLARSKLKDSHTWEYWFGFYAALLQGIEFDHRLASRVLNIEDRFWLEGPDGVANEIDRLKAELLSEKLPSAELMEFNNESGKFDIKPVPIVRKGLIEAVLGQAEDALEDVFAKASNGLTSQSREALVLNRTFDKYRDNPQRIEMDFTSVHLSLSRQIAVHEFPASEENIALEKALREGAQAIRASHPDIRQNREILNEQAILELSAEDRSTVIEALPVLEAISEGELLEDWGNDVDYLLEARFRSLGGKSALGPAVRNPILASYDEKIRLFGRAARIMLILRSAPEVVNRIDQSATYKAARIMTTIAALVALGIALIA